MKFSCATVIDVPIRKAFQLFVDKDNLKHWQKDLIDYEHISGTPGEAGSVTRLNYKRVTMVETITSKAVPYELSATYEHKRGEKTVMIHKATTRFSQLEQNTTSYTMEMEFVQVFGFIPRIMMALMGGATTRYYQNLALQFKAFSEKKISPLPAK